MLSNQQLSTSQMKESTLARNSKLRGKWSLEESILFLELHEKCTNHWIQIAESIVTKTQNDIKNHFYILLKQYMQYIKSGSFTFEGHLDLMQCYYVVKHIVNFFKHKQYTHKKDYLRTLVILEKITEGMTKPYLKKLENMFPLLKKQGWKSYYEEARNIAPIYLSGFCFPNRILPPYHSIAHETITIEEKEILKRYWAVN